MSFLPSLILVSWTFVLTASGGWSADPDLAIGIRALSQLGIGDAVLGLLATVAVALTLHPMQFLFVQILEGYWGPSSLAVGLAAAGASRHRARSERLNTIGLPDAATEDESGDYEWTLEEKIARRAAESADAMYPEVDLDIMPTRLGNVLRRGEFEIGTQYGLDETVVLPRLQAVMPSDQSSFLDDQRQELDLAVRMALTWALASVITVLFLWNKGLWLAATLLPYAMTYVAYRAAVTAADDYMFEVEVAIDLYRFDLLRALHIPLPSNSEEERSQNEALMELLGGDDGVSIVYEHPSTNPESARAI